MLIKSKFAARNNIDSKALPSNPFIEGGEQYGSDDSDGDDHFDPNDVNRPPALDAKTESQLRHACRVIVDNLKPSGHDIEDTRMVNDMYVEEALDDEAPSATYIPGKKREIKATSVGPSTWFEESSDRNSKVPHAYELQAAAEKTRSGGTLAERESYHAKRRSEHQRLSKIVKLQNDEDSAILSQVESPIAPAASVRRLSTIDHITSPIPHLPDLPHAPLGQRNASPSTTISTQPAVWTNGVTSVSTSATSAYPTPASTSKRTSDYSRRDMQETQSNAAAAGAWMKEEVDRRKQAETLTRDQFTVSPSPFKDDPETRRRSSGQTRTTTATDSQLNDPPVDDVVQESPGSQSQVQSRRESATSRRKSSTGPSFTVNGKCSERTRSPEAMRKTPSHDKTYSNTSETSTPYEAVAALPMQPVENEPTPAPPIVDSQLSARTATFDRTMAEIRARMAVTGLSSQFIGGPGFASAVNPHDVPPLRTIINPVQSENSARDQKLPATPNRLSSYTGGVPRLPPMPNQHQLDNSIIVQDFGRPTSTRARRNQPVSKMQAQTDIDAVGFDSFMNVVEKTNTRNAPPSPTSSSHYGSPTLSAAGTRPGTGLNASSEWNLDQVEPLRPLSVRQHSALSNVQSASADSSAIDALALSDPRLSENTSQTYDPQPPSETPIPAPSSGRYSSHSTIPEDHPTAAETVPNPMSSRNISAFDFLKLTPPPSNLGSSIQDDKKNDFFRVGPHPTDSSVTGIVPRTNGVGSSTDGTYSPNRAATPTATTNDHTSPPLPPKARTFSLTSHSSHRTRASESSKRNSNTYSQNNGYAPGYTYQPLSYANMPSKPGLKNWLTRRRSRSLIPAASMGMQKPARGAGFSYYNEADEDDDPLVCAAPVVAFGRGY